MAPLSALILANPVAEDRVVVGVALAERARRAAVLAGIAADRVRIVRSPTELSALPELGGPIIAIDARAQLVMTTLVERILEAGDGTRAGFDPARNQAAGICRFEQLARARHDELWNFAAVAGGLPARVDVLPVDRHPVRDDTEVPAAKAWLYQFVNKPLLDAPMTKYFYRPIARPFTKLFTHLPFTPNMITIASIIIGQIGCLIAARPGYWDHVIGIFLMAFVSGILDNVDGELSRLRLQSSKLGAWLDGVGDDVLRLSLLIALGVHCAPAYPDFPVPVIWLGVAGAVFTALTMAPMYWYCIVVLKSPNIQNYGKVMAEETGRPSAAKAFVDGLVAVGAQIGRRDFVDVATFVLALVGLPIIAVVLFAIGSFVGFLTVIPTHLRTLRERRQATAV